MPGKAEVNLVSAIEESIKNELNRYASELTAELLGKYAGEFYEKMVEHRDQCVLDIVANMKIAMCSDERRSSIEFNIKL